MKLKGLMHFALPANESDEMNEWIIDEWLLRFASLSVDDCDLDEWPVYSSKGKKVVFIFVSAFYTPFFVTSSDQPPPLS